MKTPTPDEFLNSVYLGDRACKAVHIDCWKNEVSIEVNQISRIRSPGGTWDFYSDEDIIDGKVVFTGVRSVLLDPPGPLPNDLINEIRARPLLEPSGEGIWSFEVSISSVAADGTTTEVLLQVIGADVHLEDPAHIGAKIRY